MHGRPLIVMFMGFPGSGKTYFSTHLAEALPAVTLNSDALRIAMFGSRERMEEIRAYDNERLYKDVYGAMGYAARQILKSGQSVIFDAQMVRRSDRRYVEAIAKECNATAVLVWVQTDKGIAIERGVNREERDDSHGYDEVLMHKLIKLFQVRAELPGPDENFVRVDGAIPFEQQFKVFQSKVR